LESLIINPLTTPGTSFDIITGKRDIKLFNGENSKTSGNERKGQSYEKITVIGNNCGSAAPVSPRMLYLPRWLAWS
jgi:hypothetical protein